MNRKILLTIMAIMLAWFNVTAQTASIEHVSSLPGSVTLDITMSGFTQDAGSVTLAIAYDGNLLDYTGPASAVFGGASMLINGSHQGNDVVYISWANWGGANLNNGVFFTLEFDYLGGTYTDLVFDTDVCEITDVEGGIFSVTYENGSVTPLDTDLIVTMQPVENALYGPVEVDVHFNQGFADVSVGAITFYITFDDGLLTYTGGSSAPGPNGNGTFFIGASGSNMLEIVWQNTAGLFINEGVQLTLDFDYSGVYQANLGFTVDSEITNPQGSPYQVTYVDGYITPYFSTTGGSLSIEKICAEGATYEPLPPPGGDLLVPEEISMEISAEGLSGETAGSITVNIEYDPVKMTYTGYTPVLAGPWTVSQSSGLVTFVKTDYTGFTIDGALLTMHFDYLEEQDCQTDVIFGTGTFITDFQGVVIATSFNNGWVKADSEAPALVGTIPGEDVGNVCIDSRPAAPAAADIAGLYTDNCGVVTATLLTTELSGTDCAWVVTYTYTVEDECENFAPNALVVYTGGDTEAPGLVGTIPGADVGNVCIDDKPAAPAVAVIAGLYTDNCGVVTATLVNTELAGTDCAWTVTYTYTVEDECGNFADNAVVVYFGGDTEAPVLIADDCSSLNQVKENWCLADINAFNPVTLEGDVAALYEDNCGFVTASFVYPAITGDDCGWTATFYFEINDECGNTAYCQVQYSSLRTQPPAEVGAPAVIASTVECLADAVPPTLPVVIDACGTVLNNPTLVMGGSYDGCEGTITYEYTWEDCAGLQFVWTFTYTVERITPPAMTVSVPSSSTVACIADAVAPDVSETYVETFDSFVHSGSTYLDGSFTGENGIVWNYYHSRNDEGYQIDGKGLMLRRASDSKLESEVIPGGIGSFSLNMRKAFTGTAARQLELYINNDLIATSVVFGTTEPDLTVYTFEVNNINIEGDFTIMIKNVGSTTTNRQTVIDNLTWTSYSMPTVVDVCGNALQPAGPVTGGTYDGCEGTRTYEYSYTDCAGSSFVWAYTYIIEQTTSPVIPIADVVTTVASVSEAIEPEPPAVTDACGRIVTPVMTVQNDPVQIVNAGIRTYTFTYTDCANNSAVWNYTYIIESDVPETIVLDGITVDAIECYGATQTITVENLTVTSTGDLTLIAGQSIHLLPGFSVQLEGYFHGYISDVYCENPTPLVASKEEELPEELNVTELHESFFRVYPNPTTGTFKLQLLNADEASGISVEIFGMMGERVLKHNLFGLQIHEFDLSDLPRGIYIIRVLHGDEFGTERIIKQ